MALYLQLQNIELTSHSGHRHFFRIIKPSSSLACCFTTANESARSHTPSILQSVILHRHFSYSTFAKLNIAETVKLLTEFLNFSLGCENAIKPF
jgi:hypothetical protein